MTTGAQDWRLGEIFLPLESRAAALLLSSFLRFFDTFSFVLDILEV